MTSPRQGPAIHICNGRYFWPLDPRPEDFLIEDIARALSNVCRFGGHLDEPYYVSQHSVLVARNLRTDLKLWGLLHDAPEAYISDLISPVKALIPEYSVIESRVMTAIAARFGLAGTEVPDAVKIVDEAIRRDEVMALAPGDVQYWTLSHPALGIEIAPWGPQTAQRIFLSEYEKISSG